MQKARHEIEILIYDNGNVEAQVKGVKGPACEEVIEWLAKLGEVQDRRTTPEYHQKAVRRQAVKSKF